MPGQGLTVIYDGECPFCTSYVAMMRLREEVGQVELVDARGDDPRVSDVRRAGFDLDAGMIVLWRERAFHGDQAVHLLAVLSAESGGLFNRLQRVAFASPHRAARLYPVLAAGRALFLRLAGRTPISSATPRNSSQEE